MNIDPNTQEPVNWTCQVCGKLNISGPIVNTTDAGGERWHLECIFCQAHYPVAHVTPRGVELRAKIQAARADGHQETAARLLERYQREVTRP